ncbi:type VI secretion system baseplate subunit TssK [Vitiosangium sp. GDMCC 1.1324]|uniref:type VI secretion system baseplate subunit TssK n=1 Tax=Vitiosangium sp. (strain GDMCC 1.1324) TaxID=2138576 RepID=UPI000D33EF32|nr:type VI secretion system baseplate subunit TssK [Vitiosangium sp. GDMCC 1.1324]PTL82658.1 type VI secretion system baseplate subunit TssK [Vitiosangium sp. GDMCC 1.1324]
MPPTPPIPSAVQWHEGMLLAPQHFQQQDQHHEALLHFHLQRAAPFHWGVSRLEYDRTRLVAGTLQLRELEALLPDGLFLSYQAGEGAPPLQLAFAGLTEVNWQHPVRLHVGVPTGRTSNPSRFVSTTSEPLVDESTGDTPLSIPQLTPRLQLFAGLPPAGYASLPLVEVRRLGESFAVEDYLPPLLAVGLDSTLGERCDRLSLRVRQKAAHLVEAMRDAADEPHVLAEHQRQLHWLVAGLPPYEALLRSGEVHPFTLYLALCSLAGQVAHVAEVRIPPAFPAYEHLDPLRSFQQVFDFVEGALERGLSEAYTRVQLTPEGSGFHTRLLPAWMGREMVLEVRGRPGTTRQQVLGWMAGCRIGSDTRHRQMRETRTLGARRELIEPPAGLVPRPGALLFSLEASPFYLRPDERLLLENTLEPGEVQAAADISLLIRNEP